MDKDVIPFRVLLAEDDLVSRAFLCEAIRTCGGEPVACEDGPSALAQARAADWDLLILDHHLPGRDGDAVLAALRQDRDARAHGTPAIATTAEPAHAQAALIAAGFAEVLGKPLALDDLRAALERHGCRVDPLDDGAALEVCGSPASLERLRRLFAEQELPRVQAELELHRADPEALRPTLHRLRASCGFCGATALAHASAALHRAVGTHADAATIDAALRAFSRALHETRAALHARLDHAA